MIPTLGAEVLIEISMAETTTLTWRWMKSVSHSSVIARAGANSRKICARNSNRAIVARRAEPDAHGAIV